MHERIEPIPYREEVTLSISSDTSAGAITPGGLPLLSPISSETCRYCGRSAQILSETNDTSFMVDSDSSWTSDGMFQTLIRCRCGWWAYRFLDGSHAELGGRLTEGILKSFNLDALSAPLTAIKEHLASKFADIRGIHPRKLEELIGDVIATHFHCEVRLTAQSHDGGIDMYSVDCNSPFAVQVKRRSRPVTESVVPVREFLGALVARGFRSGLFVTLADHFSRSAKSDAAAAAGSGYKLDLIDFPALRAIFDLHWRPDAHPQGEQLWQDLMAMAQRSSYWIGDPCFEGSMLGKRDVAPVSIDWKSGAEFDN